MIDVRNYGATGNGHADDGPAIAAAIAAAIKAGPNQTVHLGCGTYLFGTPAAEQDSTIRIAHAAGLTVAGEPGTILVSAAPNRTMFQISDSRDIRIHDLRLQRDRPVFSQVVVRSIDVAARTVVVAIEPGYAPLDSELVKDGKFLLVFSDPASGSWGDHGAACGWNSKDPGVCWPPTITARRRLPDGTWQLTLSMDPLQNYVGSRAVVWGGAFKGHAFSATRTHGLLVENVDYLPAGTDGGFVLSGNTGDITFRNFSVDVPAGSNQMISAIGGSMVFNNHIKLTLDHVRINRVWDDAVNMGANFARVFAQPAPDMLAVDGSRADFRVGDTLALWDWTTKAERVRARITAVACDPSSPPTCRLTLDQPVRTVRVGYAPTQSKNNDKDGIDRVVSMESAGTLHVTHSSFQSYHARDLLVRASHVLIENSELHDTPDAGLMIGPDPFWDEGPAVTDVVVRNNVFRNIGGSNVLIEKGNVSNVRVFDNQFLDYGRFFHGVSGDRTHPVLARNVPALSISGNRFSSHQAERAAPVEVEGSPDARIGQDAAPR